MKKNFAQTHLFAEDFLNISYDAIFVTDDSQRVILFNKGAERIFGYTDQEIIGKPLGIILPPSAVQVYKQQLYNPAVDLLEANLINHQPQLFGRRKDGIIFPCEAKISRTEFEGSMILTTFLRDITEDKRIEDQLSASEEKFRSYIKSSPHGIFITDEKGRFLEVNSSICRITGYSNDEMLQLSTFDLLNKESCFDGETHYKRLNDIGSSTSGLWFKAKDGSVKCLEITAVRLSKIRFLGFSKDITCQIRDEAVIKKLNSELKERVERSEKRAAELVIANIELAYQNNEKEKRAAELIIAKERAEESDRLKTAFLQNMSHEIRTPLNSIIGFSALLNFEDISKEEIREYSEAISQSGKYLVETVNNVLEISRIQTQQIVIEKRAIIINSVFSELLSFFSPIAKTKNISLNCHNKNIRLRTIYADEAKLRKILGNLINNALKFTKSGRIDFGYEFRNDYIQFYVKDTGIGIERALYSLIFEKFIQAEQSMTRNYEGAGLGLAISKGLVELLGGKIWVESEIGKGSAFYFTLPCNIMELVSPECVNAYD